MFGGAKNEKVKTVYKLVEVDKPIPRLVEDEESRKAVQTLAHHIGFQYLLEKLKLQRALLERHLKQDRHEGIREVEFLQSGVFWTNWLETQLHQALNVPTKAEVPTTIAVQEDFERLQAELERVGIEEG